MPKSKHRKKHKVKAKQYRTEDKRQKGKKARKRGWLQSMIAGAVLSNMIYEDGDK